MPQLINPNTQYDTLRRRAVKAFKHRPRGAMAECARALGTSPATLSAMLGGRVEFPHLLNRTLDWLSQTNEAKTPAPVR